MRSLQEADSIETNWVSVPETDLIIGRTHTKILEE